MKMNLKKYLSFFIFFFLISLPSLSHSLSLSHLCASLFILSLPSSRSTYLSNILSNSPSLFSPPIYFYPLSLSTSLSLYLSLSLSLFLLLPLSCYLSHSLFPSHLLSLVSHDMYIVIIFFYITEYIYKNLRLYTFIEKYISISKLKIKNRIISYILIE